MGKRESGYFFEDMPVLGKLPLEVRAEKFEEVGDKKTAKTIRAAAKAPPKKLGFGIGRTERLCEHTAHAFGFIPQIEWENDAPMQIKHAGNIKPDESLKNKRVKITLGALRAADYPGSGIHRILFDFYAQNQLPGKQVEEVHFNQTYRVMENEAAGIIGYPVFIGLNVGSQGLAFKCYTVNVKNDNDEKILDFLGSDVFQSGLKLVTTAQPAIAPLAGMAVGITKMVASRHKNVPVQDFFMGLDFSRTPKHARLAQGSYVAVQIPQKFEVTWDWKEWVYNPTNGCIVNKNDEKKLIPFNYVIINVTKYEET
jgi:hypothetical protein